MQHLTKKRLLSSFVVASLILYVLLFSITPNTITNVSGMVGEGVGVYRNIGCTDADEVFSIEWGTLTPGSANEYDVYVQNKDVDPIYLNMNTMNWSSSNAFRYLKLTWNYSRGHAIDPYDVLQLTLTLSVDPLIKDVSSFSFNIVITGSDSLLGDVNGNGVIDGLDYGTFGIAWNSHGPDIPDPGDQESENWNSNCDFNGNNVIESMDLATFVIYWGEYA